MKQLFSIIFFIIPVLLPSQELYPYTEPASNMPAKSFAVKLGTMFGKGIHEDRVVQRFTPEIQFGISKKWMLHLSATISDMQRQRFIFESSKLYAKYRFLSVDELHKHFRMAAFGQIAYSRNYLFHNEISLSGDHSGVQAGIIATQLWNKLAVSGTVSLAEVLDNSRWEKVYPQQYAYEALNYSLSAGYLLLPKTYTDYKQTNLNIYAELLGGRNLDWKYEKHFMDLATSVQLIFNSTSKLNIGYRFQLKSDIFRMMKNSKMISYEYLFLNGLKKKK